MVNGRAWDRPGTAYAALDIGGSALRLASYRADGRTLARYVISQGDPREVLGLAIKYLTSSRDGLCPPLGISSFGPLDLIRDSASFGSLTTTPKTLWRDFPLLQFFKQHYKGATCIWIDNHCSALAEYHARALNSESLIDFIGVGTGFGSGAIRAGQPLLAGGHAEFGHIFVRRHRADDFGGSCPYHGDCLEGLASGSAIEMRRASGRPDSTPDLKSLLAFYFAQAAYISSLKLAPSVIVLGGAVSLSYDILAGVQDIYSELWAGYLDPRARAVVELARTGMDSALLGAAHLGRRLWLGEETVAAWTG